ncbi:MAG: DNA methyltransferase [Polyangiales bacterium]
MSTRRPPPSAQRPWVRGPRRKRALVNVGGPADTYGDPRLAAALAAALRVAPGEDDAALTHPFHAYPARLHPAVARALIAALELPRGATVLDPFCGSGTVLIEAMVAGMRAVGRDLSPLAVALSRIKTRRTTNAERKAIVEAARAASERAAMRVEAGERRDAPRGEAVWYPSHTLAELSALRDEVEASKGVVREALPMLLSSVLVKVSFQASDTDARRVRKDIPPGAALRLFSYKSRELRACLGALAAALPPDASVDVAVDDATRLGTVPDASVDAVVTSPPYANTYDYAAHHARRYAWLGLDARAMGEGEVGAARWFRAPEAGVERFRRELAAMAGAMARALKPGGRAVVVIADGAAGERALRADEMVAEAAAGAGMKVLARASQPRPSWDRESRTAFARSPRREHAIVLERAAGAVTGGDRRGQAERE